MSRAGGRAGRKPAPGSEFSFWKAGPGEAPDNAPTPLFPDYDIPQADKLSPKEQDQVDRYRALRERFHEGPYYAVLSAATIAADNDSHERAQFDPFHGMPSYSSRYRKRKRTVPKLSGRDYVLSFFPRQLWRVVQPGFKPDSTMPMDGPVRIPGLVHGFEEEEEEEDRLAKRRRGVDDEEEDEERPRDDDDEERGEEEEEDDQLRDDDFSEDDDEMVGDYNAEQYFDAGDDDADADLFADGVGGGGDEDAF
ncbi:hypothetical protein VTN49DRAFT_1359 [Thermomyces lanuginosus]|uniref:uncharacterized protein n=1 Tax=Thermomyces lanuginosus TaxID=5541 RepID=UPI003743D3E9